MSPRPAQLVATAFIAFMLATGGSAIFSQASAQQNQDEQSAESGSSQFSEAKLAAYANAVIEVTEVVQKWQPKIQSAQNKDDKQALKDLQKQASAELVAAIQDAKGITFKEYKQISIAARQDEALYKQLNEMVRARKTAD